MSATQRPWQAGDASYPEEAYGVTLESGRDRPSGLIAAFAKSDDRDFAHRAVNVFDALLAVAKASHDDMRGPGADSRPHRSPLKTLDDALTALDVAHPGWREWEGGSA